MTIVLSTSASFSILASFWALTNVSMPIGFVFSFYVSLLVVQNMTKPFFIEKPVIAIDNITA